MLLLTITALSLLAYINYRLSGAFFYPGTVFCASWAATLALISLSGDFFYPLAAETLFIILCGGFAFSLGSALLYLRPSHSALPAKQLPSLTSRIVSLLVFMVSCGA